MRHLAAAGAAALLAAMLGSAAWAAEATAPETAPAEEAAPPKSGDQTYELKDEAESPPVNYRSDEDERYDTPSQRDAEMYAEQYEKQRKEKQVKDRKLLDSLEKVQPGSGQVGGGAADEGFPSRSPY